MIILRFIVIPLSVLLLTNCDNKKNSDKKFFGIELIDAKKGVSIDKPLSLKLSHREKTIDSASFYLDGKKVQASGPYNNLSIDISAEKLGKREIMATVFSGEYSEEVREDVILLSDRKPLLYRYEILESYPHDKAAYTQGLEFHNDTLYESTGRFKSSSLRKILYKSGEVLQKVPLADQYFGEGLTIMNDKIYQLTYKSKTGFIYDLGTLEKKGTFVYGDSQEGWGLCNDGKNIYKSDGTERIWLLDPETLAEKDHVEIYTNTSRIPQVNELEWVEGKIYANIYQRDAIAIVNPSNGAVEGVIDLSGLKTEVSQHDEIDVLNGIAYKGEPGILYITGKYWDKLFKIRILEK